MMMYSLQYVFKDDQLQRRRKEGKVRLIGEVHWKVLT